MKYYVASDDRIKTPVIYYRRKLPNLNDSNRQADFIIITHDKFYDNVAAYGEYLSSMYDLNTAITNINDLYDYFSFGYFNPEVIRDFLKLTHTKWADPSSNTGTIDDQGHDVIEYLIGVESSAPSPIADTDGDGMSDEWEIKYEGIRPVPDTGVPSLNHLIPDADNDLDGDGLTNFEEYVGKDAIPPEDSKDSTDPTKRDTDGDALWDGWEEPLFYVDNGAGNFPIIGSKGPDRVFETADDILSTD